MPPAITLIIHGTFAKKSTWWRLGQSSFADRLERELEGRGQAGTVWQPVLDAGMTYHDFSWTGENSHADRIDGARKLAHSLDQLAQRLGNTADNPLLVNLVAHSHGGNVVLESIRHLSHRVSPERVVLLGTPLLREKPAWRPGRLLRAALLAGITLLCITVASLTLVALPLVGFFPDLRGYFQPFLLVLGSSLALPLVAGMVLSVVALLLESSWWLLAWPLWAIRGRWRFQAYGPSPKKMIERLGACKVLALNSPVDEAGLGLFACCAPHQVVASKLPSAIRGSIFENLLIGPVVDFPEAVLERLAFGYSWWRILFVDISVSEEPDISYPDWAIERADVTEDLAAESDMKTFDELTLLFMRNPDVLIAREEAARIDGELGRVHRDTILIRRQLEDLDGRSPIRDLDRRLSDATDFIKQEIVVRHSLYYQNSRIVKRIADGLTCADIQTST